MSRHEKKEGSEEGPAALNEKQMQLAIAMFNGGAFKSDIAIHFKVSRQTIYNIFKEIDK